jgi:hypothetical protein
MATQKQQAGKREAIGGGKRRISRTALVVLLVVAFLVVFIPSLVIAKQQEKRQLELEHELNNLKIIQASSSPERTKLEDQIKEVESQLNTVRAAYPGPRYSTQIVTNLMALADRHDVDIVQTRVKLESGQSEKDSNPGRGKHFDITLRVEGQVPKLQNFIMELKTYDTLLVDSFYISIAGLETEMDSATLSLKFYYLEDGG